MVLALFFVTRRDGICARSVVWFIGTIFFHKKSTPLKSSSKVMTE